MMPVLIVDDSGEDATLARRVLDQCRILNPVRILRSGKECIAYFDRLASDPSEAYPCLLLLDLAMQPLNGLDVLRHLREARTAKDCVLVMLSGVGDYQAIHQGYQLGATTFLVKPLRAEDFLRMAKAMRSLMVSSTSHGYILSPKKPGEGSGLISEGPGEGRFLSS